MGGRDIEAAIAVLDGVDVEAATECTGRIGGPLVQVAHHVERALGGDAARVRAGGREPVRELVQARAVDVREDPRVARAVELDGWVDRTRVVARAGRAR